MMVHPRDHRTAIPVLQPIRLLPSCAVGLARLGAELAARGSPERRLSRGKTSKVFSKPCLQFLRTTADTCSVLTHMDNGVQIESGSNNDVLGHLGPEWRLLHSVVLTDDSGDHDHLLVGPPGVVALTTRRRPGATVWVGARSVIVDGQHTTILHDAAQPRRAFRRAAHRFVGPQDGGHPRCRVRRPGRVQPAAHAGRCSRHHRPPTPARLARVAPRPPRSGRDRSDRCGVVAHLPLTVPANRRADLALDSPARPWDYIGTDGGPF